jgi:hypothetical protein
MQHPVRLKYISREESIVMLVWDEDANRIVLDSLG